MRYTLPDLQCGTVLFLHPFLKKYWLKPVVRLASGIFWNGVVFVVFSMLLSPFRTLFSPLTNGVCCCILFVKMNSSQFLFVL